MSAPTGSDLHHDATPRDGLSPGLAAWLEPGRPRTTAAVLLLLAAVASFVAWLFLGRMLGVERAGTGQTVAFAVQGLVPVAALVTAAAFALTGSTAARVLGGVTAVVLLVQPLAILAQYWLTWNSPMPGWGDGLTLLPFVATVGLSLAASVALAAPGRARG